MTPEEITERLQGLADHERARKSLKYFRAEPGGYGHGDRFLGITVPEIRKMMKEFSGIPLATVETLLQSGFHEIRLFALLHLAARFEKCDEAAREKIYRIYLANTKYINNWDLVDTSAPPVLGGYLQGRDKGILFDLARSDSLWERRMAILATLRFIRDDEFGDTLAIASILRQDPEDLIHKAVGWMLREIGKRDRAVETAFLDRHCREMPRTMLRYAIEKFEPGERRKYLCRIVRISPIRDDLWL